MFRCLQTAIMPNLASGVRGNFLSYREGQFLRFIDPTSLRKCLQDPDGGSLSLNPILVNAEREETLVLPYPDGR